MRISTTPALLLILSFSGCSSKEVGSPSTTAPKGMVNSQAKDTASSNEKAKRVRPDPSALALPISPTIPKENRRSVEMEDRVQKASVSFVAPEGWEVKASAPTHVEVIPAVALHKDYVRTQCRITFALRSCVDDCSSERIQQGLESSWLRWAKQWVEPATRTGKPAKDAVKTSWKMTNDQSKDGFRLVSGQLTYPDDIKAKTKVRDRTITRCTQMNLGDTLSLNTECRGPLEHEALLRKGFESLCTSIKIKQHPLPTPTKEATPSPGETSK
jgi:hypothetical protein